MNRIKLSGAVFSGGGEGKKFLELPWTMRQIEEKMGFAVYPGTLNVRLAAESAKRRKLLEKAPSIKICPPQGYCNGRLIKASIGSLECAVVIPEVAGYPKDVLEVIASVNLREALRLEDGADVTVSVSL